MGKPLDKVLRLLNGDACSPFAIDTSFALHIRVGTETVPRALLIAKDNSEVPIENNASLIMDAKGNVAGTVVIFRNATERKRERQRLDVALRYADDSVATKREPFLILDEEFRVKSANMSFYRTFHGSQDETEGEIIYNVDGGCGEVVRVRTMLDDVLSHPQLVGTCCLNNFRLRTGKRVMLLSARYLEAASDAPKLRHGSKGPHFSEQ